MNIRMTTKGKRPLRSLTPCDKINAIQRIHDGESKASVARDIGVPESTLRGWCKNEDKLRFMSRQGFNDKVPSKLDNTANIMGPVEKRQRFDSTLPINFSNKIKFDEISYKRCSLNTIDVANNKQMVEMELNGISHDFATFNGSPKANIFDSDVTRPLEPPISTLSPLSGFSHLNNLNTLSQSPLALSFNDLTSNLNFLAQLHPNLAAIANLGNLAGSTSAVDIKNKSPFTTSNLKMEKSSSQVGLSVKNWAKQGPPSGESKQSTNLSQIDKSMLKIMNPILSSNTNSQLTATEDPLMYWLKTQQAMLGLNSMCSSSNVPPLSPPKRSSTPQLSVPNISPHQSASQLTAASFRLDNIEDKNMAWYNWCKALGASLSSLPIDISSKSKSGSEHSMPTNSRPESCLTSLQNISNIPLENILYSQLTKKSSSPSVHSSSSTEIIHNGDILNDPEDLSANSVKSKQSNSRSSNGNETPERSGPTSPVISSDMEPSDPQIRSTGARGIETNDQLLCKVNKKCSVSDNQSKPPSPLSYASEISFHNDPIHQDNDDYVLNNNNNSNKTDEEEKLKDLNSLKRNTSVQALKHGENFLLWLEKCSNPRITSLQLIQLRILIDAVRMDVNQKEIVVDESNVNSTDYNEKCEDLVKSKIRRRK